MINIVCRRRRRRRLEMEGIGSSAGTCYLSVANAGWKIAGILYHRNGSIGWKLLMGKELGGGASSESSQGSDVNCISFVAVSLPADVGAGRGFLARVRPAQNTLNLYQNYHPSCHGNWWRAVDRNWRLKLRSGVYAAVTPVRYRRHLGCSATRPSGGRFWIGTGVHIISSMRGEEGGGEGGFGNLIGKGSSRVSSRRQERPQENRQESSRIAKLCRFQ